MKKLLIVLVVLLWPVVGWGIEKICVEPTSIFNTSSFHLDRLDGWYMEVSCLEPGPSIRSDPTINPYKLTFPVYDSVTFACGSGSMILTWKTGILDVIYENCEKTEAAKVFFDFLTTYGYPKEKVPQIFQECRWEYQMIITHVLDKSVGQSHIESNDEIPNFLAHRMRFWLEWEIMQFEIVHSKRIKNRKGDFQWVEIWLKRKVCE